MALTLTEKQHCKNRVESKLGNRILELRESQPELIGRSEEVRMKLSAHTSPAVNHTLHQARMGAAFVGMAKMPEV